VTLIGYTMMWEQTGPKQLVRGVALADQAGGGVRAPGRGVVRLRAARGEIAADHARRKTEIFLAAIGGAAVAQTDPARTGISGRLVIQPQSPGLAERIW